MIDQKTRTLTNPKTTVKPGRPKFIPGVNDLATVNPDLTSEWDYLKNGDLKPDMVFFNSSRKVWWKCATGHTWEATISSRIKGFGCPYDSGKRVLQGENDLATVNPELAAEWDYEANGDLKPSDVKAMSDKKVEWKCDKGHTWKAMISSRMRGNKCPICNK